jgi:hypothetical protein
MIILQMDADGIAVLPFERDAPVPGNVNAIARGFAAQRMKIKAGYVHILGPAGIIKGIDTLQTAFLQRRAYIPGAAILIKLLETAMPGALDHV